MKKTNRALAVILAVVMLFGSCIFANAEGNLLAENEVPVFSDMVADGHWAKEALEFNIKAQIIKGYEDDTVRSNRNMTRAEMAAIINRAFGATVETNIDFDDVKPENWFYHEVAKAYNMHSFMGTGEHKMDPNDPIRREDVFLAMARVLVLSGGDQSVLNNYADGAEVNTWALDAMATLIEKGYINGDNKNELNPRDPMTRAEFSQFMYNIFKTYYHIEGKYDKVNTVGSVMLRGQDITLENATINGDLVLGDGVGVGDAHLTNLTIKGRLLCRGGEGYVYLKNVTVGEIVVVNDVNGTVNFYNYRDEAVFNGVKEYTPATYLQRAAGGGTGGSGGGTYYTATFVYDTYNLGVFEEDVKSQANNISPNGKIPANKFPTDAYDQSGRAFAGWYDENGQEYTTETEITQSVTLKPRWYTNETIALDLEYAEGVTDNDVIEIPAVSMNRSTDTIAAKATELLAKAEFATGYDNVHFGTGALDGIFTKDINGYTFAGNDKDVNMVKVDLVDLIGAEGLKAIFTAGYRGEILPDVDVSDKYDAPNSEVKKTIDYIIETAIADNHIKVEENNAYHKYDLAVILFRQLLEGLEWDDVKAYVPVEYAENVPEAVIKKVFERTQYAINADLVAAVNDVYYNNGAATEVDFTVLINPVSDGYVHTVELIGDNASAIKNITDWATVAKMFNTDADAPDANTGYDFVDGEEMQTILAAAIALLNDAAADANFDQADVAIGTYLKKAFAVMDMLVGTEYEFEYGRGEEEVEKLFDSYEEDMTVEDFYEAFGGSESGSGAIAGGRAAGSNDLGGDLTPGASQGGSSARRQTVTQRLPFVTVRWKLSYTIAE